MNPILMAIILVTVIGLIGAVVAAYFNHVYYTKRAALFRN